MCFVGDSQMLSFLTAVPRTATRHSAKRRLCVASHLELRQCSTDFHVLQQDGSFIIVSSVGGNKLRPCLSYLHDLALALQVIKCLPTLRFLDLPFTSSCACRPSAQVAKHRQSAPVILSNKWMVGQSSAAKTRSHFAFHMAPKAPTQTKSYHKTATIRRTQGMPLGPPAYP